MFCRRHLKSIFFLTLVGIGNVRYAKHVTNLLQTLEINNVRVQEPCSLSRCYVLPLIRTENSVNLNLAGNSFQTFI